MRAIHILVKGIVQGVGFRPFIYQLARFYRLYGHVNNTSKGVSIHIEGEDQAIDYFLKDLRQKAPPLSQIKEVITQNAPIQHLADFTILTSNITEDSLTLLSPDIAVCPECLKEIASIQDTRRYQYAFTNCTNCGPRFSIIRALPYDRALTTMQDFNMCPSCKAEYENPLNRRFHAQPTCCKLCGPSLTLLDSSGKALPVLDPIKTTRSLVRDGFIIAVKGLGGFHLICDGTSQKAIQTLRTRKNRPTKPLALMMKDLGTVLQYCCLTPKEEEVLSGAKKPILILKKKNSDLPYAISFESPSLGVMLPYTPLHHMLFDEDLKVLIATSANYSGAPIVVNNEEALETLNTIADFFLIHNRDIHACIDDSVVKVILNEERVIRPARGYSPTSFDFESNEILALGSELKNTFCISKQNLAFMSPYMGDLNTVETMNHFTQSIHHFQSIYSINPKVIAYDHHPQFSYQHLMKDFKGDKIGIYHHHAHIVSCMVENHLDKPVLGLAFDGVGYGDDGSIWGSEFLICDLKSFKRLGHFSYFKMPGGDMATHYPWRLALSLLYEAFGENLVNILPSYLRDLQIHPIVSLLKNETYCPLTCSMGRLFDGVAALLGFTKKVSYEAEACIFLENLALSRLDITSLYSYTLKQLHQSWVIDSISLIQELVSDLQKGVLPAIISRKFHNTLSLASLALCTKIRDAYHINQVALSGGVFQNELLLSDLERLLSKHHFEVFTHKKVPCNDSGLSVGQLVIASELTRK